MRALVIAVSVALAAVAVAQPSDVQWIAELRHFTPAESPHYDAWQIYSSDRQRLVKPIAPPATFGATLDAIYARDKTPRICCIALGDVSKLDGLREQAIQILVEQGALAQTSAGKPLRWKKRNGAQGRIEALRKAILQSEFVQSLDRVLRARNKQIAGLQMEKVLFALDEKPPNWLAMLWLDVDK